MALEKEDARTQSRVVLHERRKQVIRLHKKGVKPTQLVAQTGLSSTALIARSVPSRKLMSEHSSARNAPSS